MHNNTTQVDHNPLFVFTKLLKGWHREVKMLSLTSSCLEMHLLSVGTGLSMVLQTLCS